jgi:hypothetical protein
MSLALTKEMDIQPDSSHLVIVRAIDVFLTRLRHQNLGDDGPFKPDGVELIKFYFRKQRAVATPKAYSSAERMYQRLLCEVRLPNIQHEGNIYRHGFCTFLRRRVPGATWGITPQFVLASDPDEFYRLDPCDQWAPFRD